jgi:undecaprenyl diphosphate synthase
MDGNRHWSRDNDKSLEEGYLAGADAMVNTVNNCIETGVKYVTVYAFSTENWRRPEKQKDLLMMLFKKGIKDRIQEFVKAGVKVNFMGRTSDFPKAVQEAFKSAEKLTSKGKNITLNVAVSYGGRAEIIDATKQVIKDGLKPEEVTEDKFSEYIYEAGQPDPELIVRTSGEKRLSGFMLWQSFYSEFYFTDKNWPDFDKEEFNKAMEYYKNAKRNFGK